MSNVLGELMSVLPLLAVFLPRQLCIEYVLLLKKNNYFLYSVMKGLLQNITSSNIGTKAKPIMEKYVDEELARANSDEPTFLHK